MTPDQLDLARRAVADPRWRWGPGMLIGDYGPGIRFCWADDAYLHGSAAESGAWMRLPIARIGVGAYLPDLTDAATVGVILSWLPWPEISSIQVTPSGRYRSGRYRIERNGGLYDPWSSTLGEAAVRAWLALGEGR